MARFRRTRLHTTIPATVATPARTARETLRLLEQWEARYPADTTVGFAPDNQPIDRLQLEYLAAGLRPPRQHPGA